MHLHFNVSDFIKITPKEIQEFRMNTCKNCDKFKPLLHLCGECGCQMDAKVKFANSYCPIGKWEAIKE